MMCRSSIFESLVSSAGLHLLIEAPPATTPQRLRLHIVVGEMFWLMIWWMPNRSKAQFKMERLWVGQKGVCPTQLHVGGA